jgi:hypothetical protein
MSQEPISLLDFKRKKQLDQLGKLKEREDQLVLELQGLEREVLAFVAGLPKRVAIVGSRGYTNKPFVEAFVRHLSEGSVVISGGADGPDSWAEDAARSRGLQVITYIPDWEGLGKKAGVVRNQKIVDEAEVLIAFWDGQSKGTADSIRRARAKKIPVIFPEDL